MAPPERPDLATTNARVLDQHVEGARLYIIDENGDGWAAVVTSPTEVLICCDTLRPGEWSNFRPAELLVDEAFEGSSPLDERFSLRWLADAEGDAPPREFVVAVVAVLEGWR